ncbi:MAG: ABC transporter permease [Rhizobiales bacterium]|nr:ABC transporter permease [Hyphomicrobiales bacterium]
MNRLLLYRLASWALTLLAITVIAFLVLEILPGDPALVLLGPDAQPDTLEALRQQLGLNQAAVVRYFEWMSGLLRGDMGTSYTYSIPVSELIGSRLKITIPLAVLSTAIAVGLALVLGMYAAARHNRVGDYGVMAVTQIGVAIPSFWLGMLLILLFSLTLRWFSAGGFPGWEAGLWPGLRALVLPAAALAIAQAAVLTRVVRASVIEVLNQDFVRTARAKGLTRAQALRRHALRNALIPVVTVIGLQFGHLLAGTIVIENVFSLPGLGRLIFQSINQRDLMVIKNVVVLLAVIVITVNLIVDLLYLVIDPRLRHAS